MDAFSSVSATSAAWLRDSVFAPFVPAYVNHLTSRQYTAGTTRAYLGCVAHFAHWCRGRSLDLGNLQGLLRDFVQDHLPRCDCARRVQTDPRQVRAALSHLLTVLACHGVAAAAGPVGPNDSVLQRFDEYLEQARGLAASTRHRRLKIARSLILHTSSAMPSASELRQFIAGELARVSAASGASLAGALRSYLRFRAFEGELVDHLLPVIASPAHWRLAPLPQTLSVSELDRLLNAFPANLPSRLRAFAIVRCLVDLGLRSSEAINLNLDDIDWAAGTLCVAHGKSRRADVLPLPESTGRAIAEYLRSERPTTTSRRVFVRHVAPVDHPVGADVVRNTVRAAYLRAGLPQTRVHILRHTLASRLLATGGTLKEVADVLRHRELDTSMIYAKVDQTRLAAVAMPWPRSAA
ncbi:Integrase/recombinase [Polaromonas sp. CG9_12]|nr:Integrase/recombinase [Polaromonas sp. CG9_12]